jgi:hypothetical protein
MNTDLGNSTVVTAKQAARNWAHDNRVGREKADAVVQKLRNGDRLALQKAIFELHRAGDAARGELVGLIHRLGAYLAQA